eukprot:Skav207596  [mRNA]  locus=scaffold2450:126419:127356:+ [translate_table: standard]
MSYAGAARMSYAVYTRAELGRWRTMRLKVLQRPSPAELEQKAAQRAQRRSRRSSDRSSSAGRLRDRRNSQGALVLQAAPVALPVPAIPLAPADLFGLPADSGRTLLKYLNFAEQNSLRAVCCSATSLVDFGISVVAPGFTYKAELFDARLKCTRSGRVMGNRDAGRTRRFLGFLTQHATLLQRLDVRNAPTLTICKKDMRLFSLTFF